MTFGDIANYIRAKQNTVVFKNWTEEQIMLHLCEATTHNSIVVAYDGRKIEGLITFDKQADHVHIRTFVADNYSAAKALIRKLYEQYKFNTIGGIRKKKGRTVCHNATRIKKFL